jgi:predicted nucleic acid-binding protein
MVIISNATPLIAFAKIGQLALLQKIVTNLVIPKAVADEISTYPQGQPGFIDLQQESWIGVQSITSEQQVSLLLLKLDRGEAEVIALADASLTHFNSSQLIELAETSCYGTHNLKLISAKDNVCVKKASN